MLPRASGRGESWKQIQELGNAAVVEIHAVGTDGSYSSSENPGALLESAEGAGFGMPDRRHDTAMRGRTGDDVGRDQHQRQAGQSA